MCEEVLFPLNTVGDKQGLKFKDGVVTTPDGFKERLQTICRGRLADLDLAGGIRRAGHAGVFEHADARDGVFLAIFRSGSHRG